MPDPTLPSAPIASMAEIFRVAIQEVDDAQE
jgi:hypothetical protein